MHADDLRLIGITWRLDRLRWIPSDVLTAIVTSEGVCMWPSAEDEPPPAQADQQLADRLCGGCPVRDECLELELRTAGADTAGVWGGMTDDDRRELHPHWLRRGERVERGAR
ncbi:WhiB family transcriptional regulator [Amycolatopsis sp. NPDC089917]|uniref:WhiB family transcriptional regulator n=1 Tax=Amycolatopsis sp. NPDC089917 TaxID=3155187 RepID=UPI003438E9DE